MLKKPLKMQLDLIEQIHNSFENLHVVQGTNEQPPHLIALSEVEHRGQSHEIRTAISVRTNFLEDYEIEFSTNVGQLPNNPLGNTIVEGLNHRLGGKFVTLNSEQVGHIDVLYTSRKPADWLDRTKISHELENHAKTQALIKPIIANSPRYEAIPSNITFPEIKDLAQNIVDTGLGVFVKRNQQH